MGLGFSGWSRIGPCGLYAAPILVDERQRRGEAVQTVTHAQKTRAEDGLECIPRVHPVRMTETFIPVQIVKVTEQCAQVIGKDLCAQVLLQCQVIEAGYGLQSQTVLEAFERLLDALALVIERAKARGGVTLVIEQRSHQHPHATAGRDVPYQAYGARCARQCVVTGILLAGRLQRHDRFGLTTAGKCGDAVPVTCIDTHAERNFALHERGYHGVADIAAIEQQIGARLQYVQRFEQHLALGAVGRMKRGMQGQLGSRQEQRKRIVIGAQFVAATCAHTQPAAVSGDQPQAVPAHRIDMGLSQQNQVSAGQFEQFCRETLARLAESLCADGAGTAAARLQYAEQRVEFGLHACYPCPTSSARPCAARSVCDCG